MTGWIKVLIIVLAVYPIVILFIFNILNRNKVISQQKHMEDMANSLKVNDYIITISGIYGTIKNLDGNIVKLEIANGVTVKLDKSCIVGVLNK